MKSHSAPLFTTSWDDGTPSDSLVARLLERYSFRGTFYATTGPAGCRTLSDEAVRELLLAGHEIANHGRTHRLFPTLSTGELLAEVRWADAEIGRLGGFSRIVAPPRGAVSPAVIACLVANGYVVRLAPILARTAYGNGLLVPTAQFYPHSAVKTIAHLIKRRRPSAMLFVREWCTGGSLARRIARVLRKAAEHGMSVHVWGHSDELVGLDLLGEFERVLQEARRLGFRAATNSELLEVGSAGTRRP